MFPDINTCQIHAHIQVATLKKNAKFSGCRTYRYALWRVWDQSNPYVMFIGLNPSTADETEDDPTVIRCMNYALLIPFINLFKSYHMDFY